MEMLEETGLWARAMNAGRTPNEIQAKERLRTAYRAFWGNAVVLSRQIQRDVPSLTLHDEAHFEALWGAADRIVGESVSLNPLEVFVLGGAILLHDNANSLAAFGGSLDTLKETPEWQDAQAEWLSQREDFNALLLPAEANAEIMFEVLRKLHAERARSIANFTVTVDNNTFHLLQDDQLRVHLGALMGDIAASHNWDISVLSDRLPPITAPLAGMPSSWTIRPVLIACLLRCADAIQLDQKRAPDFLYGLLKLNGVSEQHWRAQNRLTRALVSPSDASALIFTSTRNFGVEDAESWWIAHDAIQVANHELQASNSMLRDLRLPVFAINRVEGALSPASLATHVRITGWRPVQAGVKITKVDKVVDMFGGEQLYGRDYSAALRELIQNAADAIRLRRALERSGSRYEGTINIRLTTCSSGGGDYWLDVEDDGIGMSEAVLTGPLIDFGSSGLRTAWLDVLCFLRSVPQSLEVPPQLAFASD